MAIKFDILPEILEKEKSNNNMFIVYFHGWGSARNESKYKILGKFGDEVYYPNIDYQSSRNLINQYINEINVGKPTLIVGSSLGGYLAFHVSNILKCPALIINPSFFMKGGAEIRPSQDCIGMPDMNKSIIISAKDDELDVKRNLKYLKETGYDEQIKIYEGLPHRIPLDVFENCFTEFREKFKNFRIEEPKSNNEISDKYPDKIVSKYSIGSKNMKKKMSTINDAEEPIAATRPPRQDEVDRHILREIVTQQEMEERLMRERDEQHRLIVEERQENYYGGEEGWGEDNV